MIRLNMKPQIIKLLFALNAVILAPMLTEKKWAGDVCATTAGCSAAIHQFI